MMFNTREKVVLLFLLYTVEASSPTVTVEQGQIVGKQYEFSTGESTHTVDAYIGIPYAEAPIGELRFKPPVPKEWQGTMIAQEYGKICPQTEVPFIRISTDAMDEDCLFLNVFVPRPTVRIN